MLLVLRDILETEYLYLKTLIHRCWIFFLKTGDCLVLKINSSEVVKAFKAFLETLYLVLLSYSRA